MPDKIELKPSQKLVRIMVVDYVLTMNYTLEEGEMPGDILQKLGDEFFKTPEIIRRTIQGYNTLVLLNRVEERILDCDTGEFIDAQRS